MTNVNVQKKKLEAANPFRRMSVADINDVIADAQATLNYFIENERITSVLSGADRQRLIRSRVKNSGFVKMAFDIVRDHPQYMPPMLTNGQLDESRRRFEALYQLTLVIHQLDRVATDAYMRQSDTCNRQGLRIYNELRSMARSKVQGAEELFTLLRDFFLKTRKKSAEPTQKELLRDANKLIKGEADGKVFIMNERPHLSGGTHKVVVSENCHP